MTRERFPIRDGATGEVYANGRWWDSQDDYDDAYEAAAERDAESRRDMELDGESED